MEHTTRIELENLKDLHAVELGVRKSKDVRRLTIENALVDTGAKRESLAQTADSHSTPPSDYPFFHKPWRCCPRPVRGFRDNPGRGGTIGTEINRD